MADETLLNTLVFGDATGYSVLPVGEYDLRITDPGGVPVLIDILPTLPGNGAVISILATADRKNQARGAFVLPSNNTGFFLVVAVEDSVFADRFKVND